LLRRILGVLNAAGTDIKGGLRNEDMGGVDYSYGGGSRLLRTSHVSPCAEFGRNLFDEQPWSFEVIAVDEPNEGEHHQTTVDCTAS
jgi:hypothetical protein